MSTAGQTDYRRQSRYTDPGPHAVCLDALPRDVAALCRVLQGLLIHDHGGLHLYGAPPPGFAGASRTTLPVAQRPR